MMTAASAMQYGGPPIGMGGGWYSKRETGMESSNGSVAFDEGALVERARAGDDSAFAELVGQEHVVKALTNALDQQRLHHAYLFTGTRGVGKTTVSRILAKSLNCEQGITATPCGQCAACLDIDAGRFVDYVLPSGHCAGLDSQIAQKLDLSGDDLLRQHDEGWDFFQSCRVAALKV